MNIQSLSVVVPNSKCVNNCAFCVSKMHCDTFPNRMDIHSPSFDLAMKDYLKRLEFARHNGCNTAMLTGTSEPQQNNVFLMLFGMFMQMMKDPFEWVEMQTTGVMLDESFLRRLRNHVGVNLISLSVSSLEDAENMHIIGASERFHFELKELCQKISAQGFSLRLSLNLTSSFDRYLGREEELFWKCRDLGADQITFRVLYSDHGRSEQSQWIKRNGASQEMVQSLSNHVMLNGTKLGVLPYGAVKYSLRGMSVVIDADCMAKKKAEDVEPSQDTYKYLILQPDCRLYSQWDDRASLIF